MNGAGRKMQEEKLAKSSDYRAFAKSEKSFVKFAKLFLKFAKLFLKFAKLFPISETAQVRKEMRARRTTTSRAAKTRMRRITRRPWRS